MRPLTDFTFDGRSKIRSVLTDIDDTLTTDGILTAQAYSALERLQRAGIRVVPVTGRPAGWCDHIARMWPVDAVVGENGAFYFRYDRRRGKMLRSFVHGDAERAANWTRMLAVRERILAEVPGCAVSADQEYRQADLAIDFCEDVEPLPWSSVDRIVGLMEHAGMTAKASSIHVNGWFGSYDKLSTTAWLFGREFGEDLNQVKSSVVFVGDSPNDAPMFGFFPNSVGVENVRRFSDCLTASPAFVTDSACGAGFAELAEALLGAAPRSN
jgi:hypothetical protein